MIDGHRQQLAGAGVHAGQAAGHAGVDRLGQGPGVDGGQGGADVAEQLGEEEGVALGAGPEGVDHGRVGQDAAHRVAGEPVEHLVGDVGVAGEVGQQGRHRVGPVDRRVAVGADDQHRDLAGGGQDVLEEADGGAVGPVEVVDHEEDGRAHGQLGDEAGGGVEQLPPVVGQRGDVGRAGAAGRGRCGPARRSATPRRPGAMAAARARISATGRVRGRRVGGAGAPQDAPAGGHHLPGQPLDEGGLAHPRLAGQEDDLAPPAERRAARPAATPECPPLGRRRREGCPDRLRQHPWRTHGHVVVIPVVIGGRPPPP